MPIATYQTVVRRARVTTAAKMCDGGLTIDVWNLGRTHRAGTLEELIVTQSERISVITQWAGVQSFS